MLLRAWRKNEKLNATALVTLCNCNHHLFHYLYIYIFKKTTKKLHKELHEQRRGVVLPYAAVHTKSCRICVQTKAFVCVHLCCFRITPHAAAAAAGLVVAVVYHCLHTLIHDNPQASFQSSHMRFQWRALLRSAWPSEGAVCVCVEGERLQVVMVKSLINQWEC